MNTDILVIGSGVSGLTFAIKCALKEPKTKIILISKDHLIEGNTRYAQGGIAVVSNFQKDSFQKHIEDTLIAGAGACDPKVVQFTVKEGNQRVQELMDWGTQFDKELTNLHLAKEGGHSEKRIVHYKDKTGLQIQEALIKKVKSFTNISLLENHILVDLITDHHTGTDFKRCYGAYIISKRQHEIIKIAARTTVLATGGAGSLFAHTTNPSGATGDGLGAAYRAKVFMESLPYVQFHPTALFPKINGNTFLITEAIRGSGALLKTVEGKRFMPDYDQRAELAPRDIVARAIEIEIQKSENSYVLLDCSSISEKKLIDRFPSIYQNCHSLGIDIPNASIPIVPAAHYFCGGIKVDEHGASNMKGLYAIGECSATGLHGANRLASNSLLESVVFSHRAALKILEELEEELLENAFYASLPEWQGEKEITNQNIIAIQKLRQEVQSTMTHKVGIFKTNKGLNEADKILNRIYKNLNAIYNENKLTTSLCELRNMVSIAHLIIKQSQEIKSNKGVFYNEDNEN
ncbi:L-aspartate oxidase [Flavobacteriaceae bacterium]|nr:L-aspartate oxidase [Flavobacteriaceae bacterium]